MACRGGKNNLQCFTCNKETAITRQIFKLLREKKKNLLENYLQ